jgi:predicted outer membrane repeat protein
MILKEIFQMKNFFLFINLFILCLVMGFSAQAKNVCGPITEDTIWTKAESPYIVTCDVTVVADVALTIEPGVTVKFDKGKSLIIDGTLVAKGTDTEKIIFTSNGAQQAGYWGYIYFSDTSEDATFDPSGNYTGGCILQFADIQWGGSGKPVLTIDNSSPFIADSLVANNSNYGISITNGSPVIKNCQIKNHSNSGIYYSGDGSTNPIIQNSTISGNSVWDAFGSGGGIYASGTITVQNSTISGNSAYWYGGGIYLYSGTLTIQNSTISGNYTLEAGGGIYLYSGTLTIQNSTISGNTGDFGGGGICATGIITIYNSTISGNSISAGAGGGIWAMGIITLTIQNSTISGNSAMDGVWAGGGIDATGGTITIQNSTISGNELAGIAISAGGGISAYGTVTIEGNTFIDNSANNDGGAVAVGGTVTLKNNVFKNNSAPSGGALYATGTVTIQGNTITENTAPTSFGGVVRLENLKASSVVGGTSCNDANLIKDNNGDAVYISGSLAFNYNDVYNNTGFELINGSSTTINASNCYWGTTNEAVIKEEIWDGLDNPALGLVTYKPFLTTPCKSDDTTPPSAVTNLSIYSVKSDSVTLNWTAPGDDGDIGTAAQYDIRYSTSEITEENWDSAMQCTGEPAPKPAGEPETFTVTDLSPDTTYYFALKTADEVPNWSGLSNVVSCKTTAKTGDVSGDGNITAFDASLILRVVVGILNLNEPEYPYLTLEVADVSGNGTVSALDAALVLQYTVGLITKFPVEITSTAAPTLSVKSEKETLMEGITRLEATELNSEQRKVLEQLKLLVFKQLMPKRTVLLQNYPNPFNPETWIPFKLAEGGKATITIYNQNGQLVRTLSLGYVPAGVYQTKTKAAYWNGRNESGELVASGVYFYNLQSGKFKATRKMVILK